MVEYKPLDPDEGPTAWVTDEYGNKYEYTVLIGSDPEDPLRSIVLSKNEIGRLKKFVK